MVGEMSVRENVLAGKCPVGEVSFGEVSFGEVSGRGIVCSGKCLSGKCQSGICPWGSVRSGNCPTILKNRLVNRLVKVVFTDILENVILLFLLFNPILYGGG